ncbi:MAG: UDP-N-acetylmuramate dehydrogenase [Granulosicoccus sp.]|jgi:UDP-N-acetylmuramate dehydrogenase
MIELNKSLKAYNSFGFDQRAERFAIARNEEQLEELVALAKNKRWPVLILGGGSNIVLTRDVPGLVIHMGNTDVDVAYAGESDNVVVRAGAGVSWHDFVLKTLDLGAQGLENLSLIPGSVGAAPVQNIGAYGVEVKDRIRTVRALHMPTAIWREFSETDCEFAYRHSFFKDSPGEYAISSVEFNLGAQCRVTAKYDSLAKQLIAQGIENPTPKNISDTVIDIRQSRLPDPSVIGNAGSFFHNPIVPIDQVLKLEGRFPDIVSFPMNDGFRKLSAAWMIDNIGYKGITLRGVGVYDKQPLVLVNLADGNGHDVVLLAKSITDSVKHMYNVELTIEPVII